MYRAGVSYNDFGTLTMKKIKIIAKAYTDKLEEQFKISDVVAFVQGRYMVDALLCTVGNMLNGKNNTRFEYPERAYSLKDKEEQLTEEEIKSQRQLFVAALQTMERNFNLNKEKNGE